MSSDPERSVSHLHVGQRTELVSRGGGVVTVSEKINEIGFGLYQIQVTILCSGFVISEAACLQTASGLSSAITNHFELSSGSGLGKSMHLMLAFSGFAIGTLASGICGDTYGRRYPMLIGYLGMIGCALCLFMAPTYAMLCMGYFGLGCFAGVGVPAALITVAEVTPSRLRGVTNAAMSISFVLGELWAALGLRMILPDLVGPAWRSMVLWSSIPPFALLVFAILSPVSTFDTPPFLGVRGRTTELVSAINLMADMNRKPQCRMALDDNIAVDKQDILSVGEALVKLTTWPYLLYVGVLNLMFFAKDLAFYGMGIFWPLAWQSSHLGGMHPATELMLTSALGLPGVAMAMLLMFTLPRRIAFSLAGIACAIGVASVHGIMDAEAPLGVTGVVLFKLFYPTVQMTTFLLPSEVFSTQIRVWSMAIICFFGRFGTLLAPVLVNYNKHAFLCTLSTLMFAAVMAVWCLPETKDLELVNSASKPDSDKGRLATKKDCESQYGSTSEGLPVKVPRAG